MTREHTRYIGVPLARVLEASRELCLQGRGYGYLKTWANSVNSRILSLCFILH